MTPAPGQELLHYRLVEKIGEGGMGVVWRARDRNLDRDVAIKVLPVELTGEPHRLARFEREAKLLARMSHPNIAQVFGLHTAGGVRFLAMEMVAGSDLSRAIASRPLGVDDSIDVGLQIASALESAHQQGIVHRDLKPANVMRTPDGQVKVLDFGLARAGESGDGSLADASRSPTLTMPETLAGTLMGTAAYMSPEQARGRPVDRRADLWAFGCVLFECLSGRKAFGGDTVSDTLAAVLRGEPDWDALPAGTPPRLRELLRRCLAKDAELRQRDAGDAGLDLRAALAEGEGVAPAGGRAAARTGRVPLWVLAAVALAALAGGVLIRQWSAPEPPPRVVRSVLTLPEGWQPLNARISPDGRRVAVVVENERGPALARSRRLLLRDLETDSDFRDVARADSEWVRFSPDSSQVAFGQFSESTPRGPALVRMPADGSSLSVVIAPWHETWPEDLVWISSDEIATVVSEPPRYIRIPIDGRTPPPPVEIHLDSPNERFLVHTLAPDGQIFGNIESWGTGYQLHAARLDMATGVVTRLTDIANEPVFIPPHWLVFTRRDQLLVARYDSASGTVGAPRAMETGLRASMTDATAALFSVSNAGDLLYTEGGAVGMDRRLVWLSEDGTTRPWGSLSAAFVEDSLDDSQDGSVIAFMVLGTSSGLYEVWASETDDPAPRPVVAKQGMDCVNPTVSPGGEQVAVLCFGDLRKYGLYVGDSSSVGTEGTLLLSSGVDARLTPASWTPDGKRLFVRRQVAGLSTMHIIDVPDDDSPAEELRRVEGLEGEVAYAMVSESGKLIAFTRWEGNAWSLQIAPWDGERAGPSRPVLRSRYPGFDWTGRAAGELEELATSDVDSRAKRVLIDPAGRVVSTEDVDNLGRAGAGILSVAYLRDGRMLAIQASGAEMKQPALRLVTGWASTLE